MDSLGAGTEICFNTGTCYTIFENTVYFDNLTDTGDNVTITNLSNTTVINVNTSQIINASCTGDCFFDAPATNTSLLFQSIGDNPLFSECTDPSKAALMINVTQEFGLTNTTADATVEMTISLHPMSQNVNYSFDLTGNHTYYVCIDPTSATYNVDAHMVFYGDGNSSDEFEKRTYFLVNATLSNTTESINLYQIRPSESDRIDFYLQDESATALDDYYIEAQRYYVEENVYRTVAIMKTDDEGLAQGYFASYDYWYKFIIKDSIGIVEDTVDAMTIKDTDITFTIISGSALQVFDYYGKVAHSCSFNNATGYLSCTVTDSSGLAHNVCLKVYKRGAVTTETVCEDCYTYSSGITVGCNIPDWTEYWYYTLYTKYDEEYVLETGDSEGFGVVVLTGLFDDLTTNKDALLLSGFTIATLSGIGIWNPVVAIIMALATLGISYYMGLVIISFSSFVGIVIVGLILIFKMRS